MTSPFRRRQQMIRGLMAGTVARATTAAPAAPDASTPAGQEYATLLVLLHENLRKLHDTASHEARIPMKLEMKDAFVPWVKGVIEAGDTGPAAQDEIVMTMMIWAVDCGDVETALTIGEHAIRHGLAMPGNFSEKTNPAAFLVDTIATKALADPHFAHLEELLVLHAITDGADMHDERRAKLAKAIGREYAERAETFDPADDNAPAGGKAAFIAAALEHFERALKLDSKVGVKKDIERMARAQKVEQAAATATE